jgi:DNA-binding SARP family transcriptional activator
VLLGGFVLARDEVPVVLAPTSQRLLAFVALAGRRVARDLAAGVLWPAVSEERAHSSLRSGLARLGARSAGVVRADALEVALDSGIAVDLDEARALAARLLSGTGSVVPGEAAEAIACLSAELLPGWYDEWVLLEAESWRQLRLHALEAVAAALAAVGRFGEAVAAAQAAVSADPLRESPHAALMSVHLSEGNQSEALREFERYRLHLDAALGLAPTARLRALLPR